VVIRVDNITESLAIIVAMYYITNSEYPKCNKHSLVYLQVEAANIPANAKLSSKIINIVEKFKVA